MSKKKEPVRTYDWNGHTDMEISYPHLTDFQMAGKVRMLMRDDLIHESVVCGARDRIMCLVKEKAALEAENLALKAKLAALEVTVAINESVDKGLHPSHITRSSDASTFDEICVKCGATDQVPGGWGRLAEPCPKAGEV